MKCGGNRKILEGTYLRRDLDAGQEEELAEDCTETQAHHGETEEDKHIST